MLQNSYIFIKKDKNEMNSAFDELFENSFKTGDYSKLKRIIEKYEQDNVCLYPYDKDAIAVLNYFINLNQKIDLNLFSSKDEHRFRCVIKSGNFKKIKSYLKKYEDFKVFEWVKDGLIEKVAEALQNGLNPNKKTGAGESLLRIASANGQTKIVRLLLKKGARINPSFFDRKKESSALRIAVYHNHTETALLLLDNGAEFMNNHGTSGILVNAIEKQNEILVQRILNIFQDKYTNDEYTRNMFWQETPALSWAIESGNERIIKLLLEARANVQGKGWHNPLRDAVLSQNKNIIDMVYEKANQQERALMVSWSMNRILPSVLFHLYQKNSPVFPEDLDRFTIEEILSFTFLQNDRTTFNEIIETLSEDEKSKIDWEKAKSSINNDLPLVVRNMITRTFKEVFQEEQEYQEITRKSAYSNQPSCLSISANTEATSDNLTITFPALISHQNTNIKPKDEGRGARTE